MDKLISELFFELQTNLPESGNFGVKTLPFSDKVLLGISPEGNPIFFIEKEFENNTKDIKLALISALFNRNCSLIQDNGKTFEKKFSLIVLHSDDYDIQQYFLNVVALLFQKLSRDPSQKELVDEINKLILLFSAATKPAMKTIQGLWAEMLIIEQSKNPEYLIRSWHSSPNSKFDFNDGQNKLEIKSTSQTKRIHSFSYEQTIPNPNSKLLIASIKVIETGVGKSILDLRDNICKKVLDLDLQYKVNEMILSSLGSDFSNISDLFFDYQYAIDETEFIDSENIPTIPLSSIPSELSNIKFSCDLSNVKSIKKEDLENSVEVLFRSL